MNAHRVSSTLRKAGSTRRAEHRHQRSAFRTQHSESSIQHSTTTVYRILFHIPSEIYGIPVFGPVVDGSITRGPGLLLILWVLFALGLMAWLVRRQGFSADTWSYVPLLLLIAAIIWGLLPAVCDQQGFPIRGFGTMLLLAVVSGVGLLLWRARRAGVDTDMILSLTFWMCLPGIVAARAFYVIEYWSEQYWPAYQKGLGPLLSEVVDVTQGGLVAYAAFLGGIAGLLVFVRVYRQPLLALCDLIAPPIILGLTFGRLGCLLNGCCFGAACDLPWAVTFPVGDRPYFSPAYVAQVERGQMYGLQLSGDPQAAPVLRKVDPDSPAGQAGLQPDDRLESIDGRKIDTAGDAHVVFWRVFHEEGRPVLLRVAGRQPVTLPAVPIPQRTLPVHPTQIYSSINALLICLLLLAYEPFRRRDGEVFALLIAIYPVTRFLLEIIRTDESPVFGTGLTISQNISLAMLLVAAGLWLYILRQPRGKAFGSGGSPQAASGPL